MNPLRLNLITLGVMLLLLGGFLFGVLMPGARQLDDRQSAVDEKLEEIADQQRQVGAVGPAYQALMDVEQDVLAIKDRIPCRRQFGAFLNELSTTLQRAGIADYQIQPLPEKRIEGENLPDDVKLARGTGILAVRLSFAGKFQSIFDVVAKINELQRLTHIEKFEVEPYTGQSLLRAQIEVHAYQFCNPNMQVCEHGKTEGDATQGDAT